MEERQDNHDPGIELRGQIESSQRNIIWPDVMHNASSADALMWQGSKRMTKVQRVGVALFGWFFVIAGLSLTSTNMQMKTPWLIYAIPLAFIAVGCKLLWNSIRRNEPRRHSTEGDDD